MNIFFLDWDPQKAAGFHADRHVVKMTLESAQLLCSAHWATGGTAPYKPTHKNHPCAIWVRESLSNYQWLARLGLYLCEEYEKRFGKIHKSKEIIQWCSEHFPDIPEHGLTPPVLAMPDDFKVADDPVQSYRNYYIQGKRHLAKWKSGRIPVWFNKER